MVSYCGDAHRSSVKSFEVRVLRLVDLNDVVGRASNISRFYPQASGVTIATDLDRELSSLACTRPTKADSIAAVSPSTQRATKPLEPSSTNKEAARPTCASPGFHGLEGGSSAAVGRQGRSNGFAVKPTRREGGGG